MVRYVGMELLGPRAAKKSPCRRIKDILGGPKGWGPKTRSPRSKFTDI